jgi:phosphohistidine phosphatase
MAPQLWLLRHGEAVPHDSKPDEERELTARGERQALAAGEGLARLGVEFDACYASPKVRALDTAKIACRALNIEPIVHEPVAGGFDRDDALELLRAHGDDARVLVVGHEPDFSQLVLDFTGGTVDFKKGGIAALREAGGSGELITLLRPRELESLALGKGGVDDGQGHLGARRE